MFSTTDTIVAMATPPGRGGIGVVRISGGEAGAVAQRVLCGERALAPRHATIVRLGTMPAGCGVRDLAIATAFPAPHSYTGEDVVEISAHGSPVILRGIVEDAVNAGARLAEPGEFTLRAFLNGRLDLVQAEAVGDLVEAVTPLQARVAFDQLDGTLTGAIGEIEQELFDLVARLEASIDFPEEGYHFITPGDVGDALERIAGGIGGLLGRARRGRMIREGRQVAILGKPNVGKSSLFNSLVGTERAIVTAVPGTTRDLVSEEVDLAGLRVRLVDTAGLCETQDVVETVGVARARAAGSVADALIVVLDRSRGLDRDDERLLEETARQERLVVVNKIDLPPAWGESELVGIEAAWVSMETREGLAQVHAGVRALVEGGEPPGEVPAVTNARHIGLLEQAGAVLGQITKQVQLGRMPEDVVLADLRLAAQALWEITGRRTTEELLRAIFSRFCVGK
jgi:tRNA modification GTPase